MAAAPSAAELVVEWIRSGLPGCDFAQSFAAAQKRTGAAAEPPPARVIPSEIRDALRGPEVAKLLQPVLEGAIRQHAAVLFVFPELRYDEDVARLAASLAADKNWQLVPRSWPVGCERRDVLFELNWRTPSGNLSSALGLAPFGAMPVTRRAPFVSLVVWPGGHDNPHRAPPRNPTRVGMVDMKHRFSKAKHDRYWENSKVKTKQRTDIELDGHAATYNVTFCLREEVRSILGAGFGPR
jgi:hypothetical protein